MSLEIYRSTAQQRLLKTMLNLMGHEVDGVSITQLSQAVGASPANTTRDVANLELAGLAERVIGSSNVRITPLLGQKALAILTNIERHAAHVEGVRQRFTRSA